MRGEFYDEDHKAFRDTVREFVRREVVPHQDAWENIGHIDPSLWGAAGNQGLLGLDFGPAGRRPCRAVPRRPGHRRPADPVAGGVGPTEAWRTCSSSSPGRLSVPTSSVRWGPVSPTS